MTNAERTRDMSDAEVLEDLKAQREKRSRPPAEPLMSGGHVVILAFAAIGIWTTLTELLPGLLTLIFGR